MIATGPEGVGAVEHPAKIVNETVVRTVKRENRHKERFIFSNKAYVIVTVSRRRFSSKRSLACEEYSPFSKKIEKN